MKQKNIFQILSALAFGFLQLMGISYVTAQDDTVFVPIIKNNGQLLDIEDNSVDDDEVLYYSDNYGKSFYFQKQMVSYVFHNMDTTGSDTMLRLDMNFLRSNAAPDIYGLPQVSTMNYYKDTDVFEDVPVVNTLQYKTLYDGINLVIYNEGLPSYAFDVSSYTSTNAIQLSWDGATSITINGEGGLDIETDAGTIEYPAPIAYQIIDDELQEVEVEYYIEGTTLSFTVGTYDNTFSLAILIGYKPAPPIPYGYGYVYWGTEINAIHLYDVKMNNDNEIFTIGYAYTYPFPANTPGQFQPGFGGIDVIVTKFNPNRSIDWATMLGGTGNDYGTRIALAPNGEAVYCASRTLSNDFFTYEGDLSYYHAAPLSSPNNNEAVLTKLDKNGHIGAFYSGTFSTYWGGNGNNYIDALVVDSDNSLFLGGGFAAGANSIFNYYSLPEDLPSLNTYYEDFPSYGGGFIAKFTVGDELVWSTALANGLGNRARVHSLAVDDADNVFAYGVTVASPGTKVTGPVDYTYNQSDVFPTVEVGSAGSFCQPSNYGGQECFIMKFNNATNNHGLEWSTLFGGDAGDGGTPYNASINLGLWGQGGIVVDKNDNIYIASTTSSDATYFPVESLTGTGVYNDLSENGYQDGFIARFNNDGNKDWCTYYGSDQGDFIAGISTNGSNTINICGYVAQQAIPSGFPLKQRTGTYYQSSPVTPATTGFIAQFDLAGYWEFSTYYSYYKGYINAITNDATDDNIVTVGECLIGRNIPYPNVFDYFLYLPLNANATSISNILQGCVGCERHGEKADELPSDLVITPNPTKQLFKLENPTKIWIDAVYIYNTTGQLIKRYENVGENQSPSFEVQTLPTGVYNVQIHTIEGIHSHKLVIE